MQDLTGGYGVHGGETLKPSVDYGVVSSPLRRIRVQHYLRSKGLTRLHREMVADC